MANTNVLALLSTKCIRKDKLEAQTIPKKVHLKISSPTKEHFVELQVIIMEHDAVYGGGTFRHGVSTLLALRDHFNLKNNLFVVDESLNEEKYKITQEYLAEVDRNSIEISPELEVYINYAYKGVRQHIQNTPGINENLKDKLLRYVDWLADELN